MANQVYGDTANLKPSQARSLLRLYNRQVPPDRIISTSLARDLLELSSQIHRQIGLFIDRRGRIDKVILGNTHSLQIPEFDRVRGVGGRLSGVRLVLTHLVNDPLNQEELADLTKLRLDLSAAIHQGPSGIQIDIATIAADSTGDTRFTVHVFDRLSIQQVAPDKLESWHRRSTENLPFPIDSFILDLESNLSQLRPLRHVEQGGTRAMALLVHPNNASSQAREHELGQLCRTANINLVEIVSQRRPQPDPRTFFGSGKLEQILIRALEQDVELLICDPELSASQARTISERTHLNVIDRTMLILDIFAQHAQSSDGKLQVELAQLRYRLPRLLGKGTMLSRLAGGIGGRGPGETKLEIDRRRAKDKIADLERRLAHLRRQREQRRSLRERSQVPVVAIVGYTNAGKSTFLNTITQSKVRAEDKLFATLDPTVRRIRFPQEREVVLLDTVGFIRDLPPALMQAFSATLEEITTADLVLHIVDISDPDIDQQISTVEQILSELDAAQIPRITIFNKCDRIDPLTIERLRSTTTTSQYYISAHDRATTRPLMEAIESFIWPNRSNKKKRSDSTTRSYLK